MFKIKNLDAVETKTTNKKTINSTVVKCDLLEFAKNEQKKESKKIFKEIIKNYPQIADEINLIIAENEKFKNENNSLLDENICLGERLELLERKLKDNDIILLKGRVKELTNELIESKNKANELYDLLIQNKETFDEMQEKYINIQNENEKLKDDFEKKRNLSGYIKDKTSLMILSAELKEYKEKWQSVGRKKLSKDIIKQIEVLFDNNYSYQKIANTLKISKASVTKYVTEYKKTN